MYCFFKENIFFLTLILIRVKVKCKTFINIYINIHYQCCFLSRVCIYCARVKFVQSRFTSSKRVLSEFFEFFHECVLRYMRIRNIHTSNARTSLSTCVYLHKYRPNCRTLNPDWMQICTRTRGANRRRGLHKCGECKECSKEERNPLSGNDNRVLTWDVVVCNVIYLYTRPPAILFIFLFLFFNLYIII